MSRKLVFSFWLFILFLSFFYDREAVLLVTQIRQSSLDSLMLFITNFGLLFGVIFLLTALFEERWINHLLIITFTLAFALETAFLLKMVFQVPRPYEIFDIQNLTTTQFFSFPSMHTTFIFAALPFFQGKLARFKKWWWAFAAAIAFSRLYIGVHTLSDLIGGGILGYSVGYFFQKLENKQKLTDWVLSHIKDQLELRRQIFHIIVGVSIIFLLNIHLLNADLLLLGSILGLILVLLAKKYRVPILEHFLGFFERPHHRAKFPGRGLFFMMVGSFLAVYLFKLNVACAAIAIMALGDSITNLVGRYFGEKKLPYNPRKNLEGVLIAVAVSTLGAFYFVPFTTALIGSAAAMFVETWDLKIGRLEIDDNLLIPVVAGLTMGFF